MHRGLKIISEVVGIGVMLLIVWASVKSWSSQSPVSMDIESIVTQVNQYCADGQISDKGTCNSLLQKLQGAIEARDRGQPQVACNKLNAFVNEVQAQSGKKIDPAAAQVLINLVTPLCSPAPTVTPTAIVISPLPTPKPQLLTVIFTLSGGAHGPDELYQVTLDYQGQVISPAIKLNFPFEPNRSIVGFYPSPNNKKVVIQSVPPYNSYHLDILDLTTLQQIDLMSKKANLASNEQFFAWHPNNQEILITGEPPTFPAGRAWLVDIDTHDQTDRSQIKMKFVFCRLGGGAFLSDGQTIVYSLDPCKGITPNQIWRVNTDGSNKQLLFAGPDSYSTVNDLSWSPHRDRIAFIYWSEGFSDESVGQLYTIKADGSELKSLSPAVADIRHSFNPLWWSDNQQIAFVNQVNGLQNIYLANVRTNQITPWTQLASPHLSRLAWLRPNTELSFMVELEGKTWFRIMTPQGDLKGQFDINLLLQQVEAQNLSQLTTKWLNPTKIMVVNTEVK